jgi:hypothetical protein
VYSRVKKVFEEKRELEVKDSAELRKVLSEKFNDSLVSLYSGTIGVVNPKGVYVTITEKGKRITLILVQAHIVPGYY